jgi:hypothetical protein
LKEQDELNVNKTYQIESNSSPPDD